MEGQVAPARAPLTARRALPVRRHAPQTSRELPCICTMPSHRMPSTRYGTLCAPIRGRMAPRMPRHDGSRLTHLSHMVQPAARAELPPRMSATAHKKSLTKTEGTRARATRSRRRASVYLLTYYLPRARHDIKIILFAAALCGFGSTLPRR